MSADLRPYRHPEDFNAVSAFLVDTYEPGRQPSNWLQPRWEYMHFLCVPFLGLTVEDLSHIGIWEDNGAIVGLVHFEERYGEAYFQTHPDYALLNDDMLAHAQAHLSARSDDGVRALSAFISDSDAALQSAAHQRGFRKKHEGASYMSRIDPATLPGPPPLPEGFALKSLADGNDRAKAARVLHRGFNHPGEPPEGAAADRRILEAAPNFRKDLTIVVQAPTGDFVSYCEIWYEPTNRFAMVEPVATDPDYRMMGLGKAAVLEAIRRTAGLGARAAYVGTDLAFYLAIGFERMSAYDVWEKRW